MNGFKQLVIENFQSHQHTVIDFSQGLNVFVGPSDSGKSAILRALRWLLFNAPRGAEFIRSGSKECRVTLTFRDGAEVVRVRGTSVNRYILRTKEGEEHVFEGFGNEIPQEITDMHGIQALKLDGKEIVVHLGTQLESPFLLFETAGNKAKTIGRVSGAHLIDKAFKKTTNDRHTTNLELKRLEQEAEDLTEKLQPYSNLKEIEHQLCSAENAFLKARKASSQMVQLQTLKESFHFVRLEQGIHRKWSMQKNNILLMDETVKGIEQKIMVLNQTVRLHRKWMSLQNEKRTVRKVIANVDGVFKADETMEEIFEQVQYLTRIRDIRRRWVRVQAEKDILHLLISKATGVFETEKMLQKLDQMVRKKFELTSIHSKWTDIKSRIARGKQFKIEREKEIALLIKKWVQVLKELRKCPTCGSEIHSAVMEHIIQEYQGGNSYVAAGREHSND